MNRAPMGQRTLMCLAMLGGLVLSATTLASPQWSADARFKAMDSNGDGRVSAVEHAASASMMFNKMDANRDGSVTAAEMDASSKMMMKDDKAGMGRDGKMMKGKHMPMHHQMSVGKIKMMDSNGDGRVSAAEHAVGTSMMFTKMDANGDGSVTAAEMEAHGNMMMKGKPMPMHHQMPSAGKFKAMDANGDGWVSAAEHAAHAAMMFGKMDANRDGKLTMAEMQAGHADMMGKKKGM